MNTIGTILRLTTAGESHGTALCGILDGMPPGHRIDLEAVSAEMALRRPGHGVGSARREDDEVSILSGMLDGVTTGAPIAFTIANNNARSTDYDHLRFTFRPSHADYTYQVKYGLRDHRGGGRASARETAIRVAAGAMAAQVLANHGIDITAYTRSLGEVDSKLPFDIYCHYDIYASPVRCPDSHASARMVQALSEAARSGSSLGGIVACVATGVPAGLGEPIYGKLSAQLAFAMMSIPAAHGFEYGDGFSGTAIPGHEALDLFVPGADGTLTTATNHSGGIQGGISNGAPITMNVAFKPIATLMREVPACDTDSNPVVIAPRGRHDVSAVPRAVPVVKAMASLVLLDALLISQTVKI